jgi:hypothetical protein
MVSDLERIRIGDSVGGVSFLLAASWAIAWDARTRRHVEDAPSRTAEPTDTAELTIASSR